MYQWNPEKKLHFAIYRKALGHIHSLFLFFLNFKETFLGETQF